MVDIDAFHVLQEAARTGSYHAIDHFKARATERGFTLAQALDLLAQDSALAWQVGRFIWIITEPLAAEPCRQLHVRVKLQNCRAFLITGWIGHPQRTSRRWAGREVETRRELLT